MRPARFISSLILVITSALVLTGCDSPSTPTPTLVKRGNHSFEYHNWADAAKKYEEVLAREPHDGEIQYRYGVCLLELGDYSKAESALELAHSLDPRNDDIVFARAQALYKKKEYGRLFTMLRDRANDNRSIATWLVLASYSEKLNDFDTAMEALSSACAIEDGTNSTPYYRSAVLLARVGRSEEAVRRLRQAYAIAPADEQVNVMLVEYGEIPGPTLGLGPGK